MSWLYSQALVAGYLAENSLDGAPFAPSNGSPTPQAFLSPDKMTAFSRLSRFGMTFAPLTDAPGEDLLMWFRAGFPAKTSVQPAEARALMASEAGCGWRWPESSVKFDPATSSWKTRQCSLLEGLDEFSETWPRWGIMRDGECWEQDTPEGLTSGIGCGLWPTPRTTGLDGGSNSRKAAKARDRWPTPRSCSAMAATITPESAHAGNRFPNLETVVGRRTWPTPTAHNAKECDAPSERTRNEPTLCHQARGGDETLPTALNPPWVEWLMGWPLEWTDLKPLETARFQAWLLSHGESSAKPNP